MATCFRKRTPRYLAVKRSSGLQPTSFCGYAFARLILKNGTSVNEVSQRSAIRRWSLRWSTHAQVIEHVAREAVNVLANSLSRR